MPRLDLLLANIDVSLLGCIDKRLARSAAQYFPFHCIKARLFCRQQHRPIPDRPIHNQIFCSFTH